MQKRHFLKLSALLALVAVNHSAFAADAATENLEKRIAEKDTITIGTEGTYAPFTFHDENGHLTGYDVEVARAVAKKLGVTPEFKETQWDAMLAGLNSNRFDLVANQVGLTSPERRAKYDITDRYSYSGAVAVTRKNDDRVHQWEDIKGLKAAQSFTSNYGEMARKYGAEIVGVDGLAQSLQLLLQKRADITMNDRLAVLDFIKKHPDAPLTIALRVPKEQQIGSGFVFNKGNEATIEKFNKALAELREEGVLKQLSEQFFGEDVSQP
ncbi:amino acid ABC transporter substrate-binding protein [Suttonella ornithocola]|uniref:Probable amino-acid ABC transporter-binding protein HI_1080 n=1 Tax=Suttonella ornithocola TaxID=279832 RepID=A0A380MT99_9GAMM|nr:amino acid ABC transporter substrate-binding protein [Suttonella ornithocola]SUO95839.1 Probable amino-acid ABC transporter-binding protein HI_1080 precursor [Suttonella ornithocola]